MCGTTLPQSSCIRNYDQSDNFNHGIALTELVAYIHETRMNSGVAPVLKLSDLVELYSSRLEQLGVQQNSCPHSTDLKNCILAQVSDFEASKEGRDVLLAFNNVCVQPCVKHVSWILMTMLYACHEQPKLYEEISYIWQNLLTYLIKIATKKICTSFTTGTG